MKNKNAPPEPKKKVKIEKLEDVTGKDFFAVQNFLMHNNYRWSVNARLSNMSEEKPYVVIFVDDYNEVTSYEE